MVDVSVLIASRNCASFLPCALKSLIDQSLSDWEAIVVDDASDDDTETVVRRFAQLDTRIRYIGLCNRSGPSAARNTAIDAAQGRWVAILDADDWFGPDRLKNLVHLANNTAADVVCDGVMLVNPDGRLSTMFSGQSELPSRLNLTRFLEGNMPNPARPRQGFGFLKPLINRDFVNRHGLRYDKNMLFAEDYTFYAELLLRGARWALRPEAEYFYRVRSGSLTAEHGIADLQNLLQADRHLMTSLPQDRLSERDALRAHLISTKERLAWRQLISAWKRRDLAAGMLLFLDQPQVALYLTRNLSREFVRRTITRSAVTEAQ
jgi:glycosyltransferase involved in cell wall biosynthesis